MPAKKDALSQMGLTRRPVFEIFGGSQEIGGSPMYAPAFREAALEDQAIRANQQQFYLDAGAQDAAAKYFQQGPSTRQQFLDENPVIAASPQFGAIAQYERMLAPSAADKTLMPSMARRLPPALRQGFYDKVQSGVGVLNAFDATEMEGEQLGLKEKLFATGASDEDIQKAFPDGQFDPARVARFEAQRKLAADKDPETSAIDKYHTMLTRQAKLEFETTGTVNPETEAERVRVSELLSNKLKSKLPGAAPAVAPGEVIAPEAGAAPAVVPVTGAVVPPVTEPAVAPRTAPVSYVDLIEQSKRAPDKAVEEISQQWTTAKSELERKLDAVVPDKKVPGTDTNQREAFARAILDGEEVIDSTGPVDDYGNLPREPLGDVTLKQIGIQPAGIAFEEKGNLRTGSQAVKNFELLRAWAEDYLNRKGKLLPTKESATGSVPTPEQEEAFKKLQKIIRGED